MLTVRKRGATWHCRGSVKAAGQTRVVKEHSTGETREAEALAYAEKLATDIREELRGGRTATARRLTLSDAVVRLVDSASFTKQDQQLLGALNEGLGDTLMADLTAAVWGDFVRRRLSGRAPATVDRHIYMLRRLFGAAAEDGIAFPKDIKSPRTKNVKRRSRRVRWLTAAEADRLERAYAHGKAGVNRLTSAALAAVLRYQGTRVQEALQIDRRHVLLNEGPHGSLYIPESKNGLARTVAMHPRTRVAILPLLLLKRPAILIPDERRSFEPLFVGRRGEPYRDTRGEGGNPLSKKHATACRFAGIHDFTVHDWRRNWACNCLASGMDAWTLMQLGGWTDYESVAHYVAAVAGDRDHQGDKLAEVA